MVGVIFQKLTYETASTGCLQLELKTKCQVRLQRKIGSFLGGGIVGVVLFFSN